jgi:NAD(P)-dependent dehydrogenase (short-subunit alcohol dehydrogenase family)
VKLNPTKAKNNLRALVIGASGGIGQALVEYLANSGDYQQIFAVSRTPAKSPIEGVQYHRLESDDESAVTKYCQTLYSKSEQFTLVVCCIGSLHGKNVQGGAVMPEKRIEDINSNNLSFYFTTNTILPAIWLKHVEFLLKGVLPAKLVFLSARVGSITDNKLGGWYGYRASKSALNMLIKSAQIEFSRRAKNITLVSYHPGTVKTKLSEPFRNNVPEGKLFEAEFTVSQMLSHIQFLDPENGPYYIDWQGKVIPW